MAARVSGAHALSVYHVQFTSELESLEKLTAEHLNDNFRPSVEELQALAKRVDGLVSQLRAEEGEDEHLIDDFHALDINGENDFIEVQGFDSIKARVDRVRSWIEMRQKEADDRQYHFSGTWILPEKKKQDPEPVLIQAPPAQPLPQSMSFGECYTAVLDIFSQNLSDGERRDRLNAHLALLPVDLRGLVYWYVWDLGGKQAGSQWAQAHIGESQDRLIHAFQQVLAGKIRALNPQRKGELYRAVYQAAGSPQTADRSWGENHVFDNIPRLWATMERLQVKDKVAF